MHQKKDKTDMSILKGQFLARLFFDEGKRVGERWNCRERSMLILRRMSGHSNLCHHTRSRHDFKSELPQMTARPRSTEITRLLCFTAETHAAHVWLERVILCLKSFSYVRNNIIWQHFQHNSISVNSLKRYMHSPTHISRAKRFVSDP